MYLFQEFNLQIKPEIKTSSSLRSVRVKSDRMKDTTSKEKIDNELSPVKVEEMIDVKSPAISLNNKTVPSKDSEPLTSAVAPVAQKLVPEKSLSPTECKEEGAILKTEEAASASKEKDDEDDDDVVEVPYKSQIPINLEEESKSDISLMQDVKRRKLDILKEGGLEVTPVVSGKDVRPSVIQQVIVPRSLISTDAQHMPPPPSSTVPVKRTSQIPSPKPAIGYVNGQSPPKVVQSKSIYSYSEKTVYGNPKDLLAVNLAHSPRVGVRQSGGDVLDLRVTSPQKPVVEIMRVPSATTLPLNISRSMYNRAPPPPPPPLPFEGRKIGSNLEITLVGPPQPVKSPYSVHNKYISANTPASRKYMPHKRTLSDNYTNSKYSKLEENGKNIRVNGMPPPALPPHEITVPNPYVSGSHMKPLPSSNSKQFSSTVPRPPPMLPNYLPLLQSTNKTVPPFMPPVMDPLYLSALQNMYSANSVAPPPPIFPMATPEHLQLYSELMAQNARARFPFPFPDTNPSVTTTENKKL